MSEAERLVLLDDQEALLLQVVCGAIDGVVVDDHDVVGIFGGSMARGKRMQRADGEGEVVASGEDEEGVAALGGGLVQRPAD